MAGPCWERLRTCLWFWRGSVAVWGLRHSTRAGSEDGPKEGGRRQRWGKNGVGSVHGAPAQWLGSWLSANIVPTSCPRPETLGKREDPWGLGRVPSPALASPHQPAVSGVGSPGHPASPQVRPGHSHSTFAFSGSPWLKVQVLAAWPQAACLVAFGEQCRTLAQLYWLPPQQVRGRRAPPHSSGAAPPRRHCTAGSLHCAGESFQSQAGAGKESGAILGAVMTGMGTGKGSGPVGQGFLQWE
ncbi:uncharacterized protein LOC118923175 [Manis pentadactyla]|uniref:uncharacterized protein LOC118923175 n=1 Tax=Manis pentadactyla TaxID=143292 RepID=UPI00255CD60F|nr:uncharacterized protein LOC118923175 [Manis pentadactyla]